MLFTQRIIEGMGGVGDTYALRRRDDARLGARRITSTSSTTCCRRSTRCARAG